ncbi:hypothetical protein G9A89_020925 [Geosiphon pyriformis]|nr:hypothetical protein G9A89_020925 [Geosiphon pyriformis]
MKAVSSGSSSGSKAPLSAFFGPVGGFFSQKKRVSLCNIKHSGVKSGVFLAKPHSNGGMYSDMESDFNSGIVDDVLISSSNKSFLSSAATTPKTKRVKNDLVCGSPLGFLDYDMDDNDGGFLSPLLDISLKKKWLDSKIVKTQMEVAVKKSFALNINLSAVEGKLATAKTQVIRKLFSKINGFGGATTPSKFEGIIRLMFTSEKNMRKAASLAKKEGIIVNNNVKKQGLHSDQAVVIKEIPMDMPNDMIVAAVFKFGQVVSIQLQLIGLWQKTVMEFTKSSQADQLAAKWSFLIRKDSVCVTKTVGDYKTWASRDQYKALLFTLLVGTTAHNLGNFLAGADTGNRVHCAVVCFENDKVLESAFRMEPIFGGVRLSWARLDLVWYEQCGKLGHSVLECNAEISTPPKLSKSFKRVVSDENHFQLAKLCVKKSVPISRLAAFGSKSWAQVVSLISLSNGLHFSSGSGFGSSSGASGVIGHLSFVVSVYSILETRLIFLERSLELLTDKVSGIPLIISVIANVEFGSDIVLDDSKPVVSSPSSVSSGVSNLGSSVKVDGSQSFGLFGIGEVRSDVCWFRFCGLFFISINSLVWRIATYNVRGVNIPAKQDDVVRWHMDSENHIFIITETKLKSGVKPWIMNKFPGVRIFTSRLDTDSSGAGVAVIMNFSVAWHVSKINEIPSWLISIRLLFKGKLSVTILGIYANASAGVQFGQALAVNFLIASAINSSSFVILGGDFNELNIKKSASLRKCTDLSLVNSFKGHFLASSPMWNNSRGVKKVIDYIFASENLVSALIKWDIGMVTEFFNMDYKMISLNSIHKQANRDRWKFDFKDADPSKWLQFRDNVSAALSLIIGSFLSAKVLSNLDEMWDILCKVMVRAANTIFSRCWFSKFDCSKNRHSSRFLGLELLVAKVVKSLNTETFKFDFLVQNGTDLVKVFKYLSQIKKCYRKSKYYESRSAINKHMKNFSSNKGGMIRSILERSFHKIVLDHLVIGNKLVLDPIEVKSRVNNDAFSDVMNNIHFSELVNVILDLSDGKAAGLSGISNELWKHCGDNMLECFLSLLNSCLNIGEVLALWKKAWVSMIPKPYEWNGILTNTKPIVLIETARKILSKLLSNYISSVCSRFGVLRDDNFSVLKAGVFVDNTIWIGNGQASMQHILDIAGKFFEINDIAINSEKTMAIPINKRVLDASLHINGLFISIAKQGEAHRYLSIFLSTNSEALHHPSLYGVRTFEQIQAEEKVALLVWFLNASDILGHLFKHYFLDLQILGWAPLNPLRHSVKLRVSLFNNFLTGMVRIFLDNDIYLANNLLCAFCGAGRFLVLTILGSSFYFGVVPSLKCFGVAFGDRGSVPLWYFKVSAYMDGHHFIPGGLSTVSGGSNFFDLERYLVVQEHLHKSWSDAFAVYIDGFLSHLGTAKVVGGAAAYFPDAGMSIGIKVSGLLSSTMAELHAVVLALECVPFLCLVVINTNSQATINVCASELGLIAPNFKNKFWVERHYIRKLIEDKDLSIGWVKVKGHSGDAYNDKTNALAGRATHSNLFLPMSVWEKYVMACDQVVSGNARYFVWDIYRSICHVQWKAGPGSVVINKNLIVRVDWKCTASVWHLNSHMLLGFTSQASAVLCIYLMKVVHRKLPVAIHKKLYDKCYPGVLCLMCGDVELSNHVFTCQSEAAVHADILLGGTILWKSLLVNCSLASSSMLHTLLASCHNSGVVDIEHCGLVCALEIPVGLSADSIKHLSGGIVCLLGIDEAFAISFDSGWAALVKRNKKKNKTKEMVICEKFLVNNNVRKPSSCLDWEIVVKKISVNLFKLVVESVFSKFSKIVSIKIQLIGLWQKALVNYESSEITNLVTARWSVFMEKNSVHVTKAIDNKQSWVSRDLHWALLYTLPAGTTAHDLSNLFESYGGKTCFIGHNPSLYVHDRCVIVCFVDETSKLTAIDSTPVFKSVNLCWAGFSLTYCAYCKQFGYISTVCFLGKNSGAYAESAFNFYVNEKIAYLLGTSVNIESVKETFYNELIQNTSLLTNHNFASIITKINKEIKHHTQQRYPITYTNKGKKKLQTPAVTPQRIQPPTWKKTRVKSPNNPSYHYTPGSAINISSTDVSTSNATSVFGHFPFQSKQRKEDLLELYNEYFEEFKSQLLMPLGFQSLPPQLNFGIVSPWKITELEREQEVKEEEESED